MVDYKNKENKSLLENKITRLLDKYSLLLSNLIGSDSGYKRGAILYYWLNDYHNYLKNEQQFNCKYCPSLAIGNIISVNFGFNLGSEVGGLHYAIVLSNSAPTNPVVTVVPLRSIKSHEDPTNLRGNDIFLSTELFDKLHGKYQGLNLAYNASIDKLQSRIKDLDLNDSSAQAKKIMEECKKELEELKRKSQQLDKTMETISKLKWGSVALVNQIQTISKMRIDDPKNQYGILYDIKLSRPKMQLIQKEIIKLYQIETK